MQTIPTGAKGSFNLVVTPEHLANRFKDAMLPPILATPVMIMVMGDVPFTDAIRVISRWGSGAKNLVAAMERRESVAPTMP